MPDKAEILDSVRDALLADPKIDARHHTVTSDLADDGTLTLEGDLPSIAAKKLALKAAIQVPGVTGIADRLRVLPAQPMGDRDIRDSVRDHLLQDTAFANLTIRYWDKGTLEMVRMPPMDERGLIDIAVENSVVTLNGAVPGLVLKRLAGVLAWWVPGVRDVINGLTVEPPEEDSDAAVTDAVRIALEKDPYVNAGQVRVSARDAVVTLEGVVPAESEKDMAEKDAWYVFGVDNVINRIEWRP